MSLRYRLFFWVSGLFVLAATCSYFLENHTTAKEMKIAIKNMRAKIEASGEEKRVALQEFVGESIAENMVKIDAVLDGILKFSPQALRFAPTDYNTKQGTWASCTSLVLDYKWMGLLQNTAGAKELAGFQPYTPNRVSTYQIPINHDLFWSYFGDLAARLCSAAKAGEILISEATLEQVSSHVVAEPLAPLSLKGFDTPFSLYRLRGLSSNKKKEVE